MLNHLALARAARDSPLRKKAGEEAVAVNQLKDRALLQKFAAEITGLSKNFHTVVISNENFCWMTSSPTELTALKTILEPHFDSIEIVVYMRRQDEHYASLYAQGLRQGYLRRPMPYHEIMNSDTYYDYNAMLNRWGAVFTTAILRPRVFERPETGRFDVVEDFFSILGIEVPSLPNEELANSNVSMNAAGQKVLLRMRSAMKDDIHKNNDQIWPVWTGITTTIDKLHPGKGWRMSAEDSQQFMQTYEAGNENVRRIYFPERARLFRELTPSSEDTSLPNDRVAMTAACAVIRSLSEQLRDERFKMASMMVNLAQKYGDSTVEQQGLKMQAVMKPTDPEINLAHARSRLASGNLLEAAAVLARILKADPANEDAARLLKSMTETQVNAQSQSAPTHDRVEDEEDDEFED